MAIKKLAAAVIAAALTLTLLPLASASAVGGFPQLSLTAASSGTAGVAQPVTVTITDTAGMNPSGSFASFLANGSVFATAPLAYNGSTWTATTSWTPTSTGTIALSSLWASGVSNTVYSTIGGVSTVTQVTSPSYAQLGSWQQVSISVTASNGQVAPTGTVQLTASDGFSQVLTLNQGTGAVSTATAQYYAGTPGTISFQATYTPTGGAMASTSQVDTMNVGQAASAVSILLPSQITAGVPANLTVVSGATPNGFVTITANGVTIANQVYFTGGMYTQTVTPKAAGAYQLNATVVSPQGATYTGSDTAIVYAPVSSDVVTLSISGYGALSPTTPFNAANGSVFTMVATSASGAPVTVTSASPCLVNGSTLTIQTGQGYCTLSAYSPGGNGRSAVTTLFPVQLTPGTQTAQISPKASGKYSAGSKVYLAPVGAATNAGQTIKWKLTGGSSKCSLVKKDNKQYVKLPDAKDKNCQVTGSAPAVPGAWNAYEIVRKYTSK